MTVPGRTGAIRRTGDGRPSAASTTGRGIGVPRSTAVTAVGPDARPGVAEDRSTDAELIAASTTDPPRFAAVFDRHYDVIHRFLCTRVGARAEDVTAEVFKVAFQQRDRYDPSFPSARPWLFGIAARLAKQQHREEARTDEVVSRLGAEPTHTADMGPERLTELAPSSPVAQAVLELPPRDRDPLLLHAWDDLSYEEVAHVLDVPLGTVRSRIHRARRQLRSRLSSEPGKSSEPGEPAAPDVDRSASGGATHG